MGPAEQEFLASLTVSPLASFQPVAWTAAALFSAGAGLFAARQVRRHVLPPPVETGVRQHINFDRVLKDGSTLRRGDGRLLRVISLAGVDRGALPQGLKDELYERVKRSYEAFQERPEIELRIFERKVRMPMRLEGHWEAPALQELYETYQTGFTETFRQLFFLVLSIGPREKNARAVLERATEEMLADLHDFAPTLLSNHPVEVRKGAEVQRVSPLLSVWSELLNPVNPAPVPPTARDLTGQVAWTTYQFDDDADGGRGVLHFVDGPRTVYGQVCCVSKWGEVNSELTIQAIMAIPASITVCHLIEPWSQLRALNNVRSKRKWSVASAVQPDVRDQFEQAEQMLTPGSPTRQSIMRYQMAVIVYADDLEELEETIKAVRIALRQVEATMVVAPSGPAERIWWSQVPGHRQFVFYQDLWSGNVAQLAQFNAPATGCSRSEWGEGAIVPLRQIGGAPYNFTFHVSERSEEVGHMVIYGPTGVGKSLLMNFLMGASLRLPRVRWFRFDRDQGAYPFVRCLGSLGTFLALQSDLEGPDSCVINPFQMNLGSQANADFLRRWLRDRANDMKPDLDQILLMNEIDSFMRHLTDGRTPMEERSLSAVFKSIFNRSLDCYPALEAWANPSLYGRFINGTRDTFDPKKGGRVVAIDVTAVFKDPILAAALIDYFWFRMIGYARETGDPWGLFIDETEPMCRQSAHFVDEVLRPGLQESRRARGVVVVAFQRQQAIHELGISDLIQEQCKTQIYLRNPKAKRADFRDLTEEQFDIMKGRHPTVRGKPYTMLIVRDTPTGTESVVVDFDLSWVGRPLKILRGGRQAIDAIVALERRHGRDFLEPYLRDDFVGLLDEAEEEEVTSAA